VFETKKRFGLSVLNYLVTSNHSDLLPARRCSDSAAKIWPV